MKKKNRMGASLLTYTCCRASDDAQKESSPEINDFNYDEFFSKFETFVIRQHRVGAG